MKKILVFLLLITGLVKSQVVVPKSTTTFSNINAVGSVTVGGNLRVSGSETVTGNAVINKVRVGSTTAPSATLDVTGTMSVSGTSTLTGAVNTGSVYGAVSSLVLGSVSGNNSITLRYGNMDFTGAGHSGNGVNPVYSFITPAHYSITASTNVPAFKLTGATRGFLSGAKSLQYESYLTAPTYTANGATTITTASGLHVEKPIAGSNITITNNYGISTNGNLLLGSAGLTGGNTGTVAVLSDAVFQFTGTGLTAAMGDASTYYFGNAPQTLQTSSVSPFYMPYNATLIGYVANFVVNGGASSAETGTLGINIAGTTTTLSTGITMNAGTGINTFTATGLSVNVNAGQMFCPYITTPTWVTNPGTTATGITFLFVRRP